LTKVQFCIPFFEQPENPTQGDSSVSVRHLLDPASGVLITTYYGRVTFQETLDSISTLRQNSLFRPTLPHLADLSGISKFEFTRQDIRDLQRSHDPFTNDHRAALVVTGVTRAAAVLFRALSGTPNLGLFSSLPDALSWLWAPPFFRDTLRGSAARTRRFPTVPSSSQRPNATILLFDGR
jgi:hypothetical protein